MTATVMTRPFPKAPKATPWEEVGSYLEQVDPERYVLRGEDPPEFENPTYADVGEITQLEHDLRIDIAYMQGVQTKLDDLIGRLVADVRDAQVAS